MSDVKNVTATTPAPDDMETLKAKQQGAGVLKIDRSLDGQTISIYIRHPLLASIIREMTPGNAPAAEYAPIYKDILNHIPGHKERVISRPAVCKVTKNFMADAKFSWEYPSGILVYNPEALEKGFTLTYKVDQPFDPAVARRWGKMFLDGCDDLIANARPFQMTWIHKEKDAEPKPQGDTLAKIASTPIPPGLLEDPEDSPF